MLVLCSAKIGLWEAYPWTMHSQIKLVLHYKGFNHYCSFAMIIGLSDLSMPGRLALG